MSNISPRNSFESVYLQGSQINPNDRTIQQEVLEPVQVQMLNNLKLTIMSEIPDPFQTDAKLELGLQSALQKWSLPCLVINQEDFEESIASNKPSLGHIPAQQFVTAPITSEDYDLKLRNSKEQQRHTKSSKKSRISKSWQQIISKKAEIQSQKKKLMFLIEQACQFLTKGTLLNKYCFGRTKIQQVVLFFSEDLSQMGLFLSQKQEMQYYSMQQFVDGFVGLKTKRFQEYLEDGYQLQEDSCFSLVFKQRSFDFSAGDGHTAYKTIEHIRLLRACLI